MFYNCSDQNLTRTRMWHMSKLPRSSPKISTNLRVHPEVSATFSLTRTAYYPKDIPDPSRSPPFRGLFHSKPLPLWCPHLLRVFSTSRPSHSEGFSSEPEAPTIDHPWSLMIVIQLHPRHVHNSNAPINEAVMDSGRYSYMQSQPTSASDNDRYNKTSTCRSCSYNNPSIPPPRQHPWGINYPSSARRKEVASLIFRAHTFPGLY